MPLSNEPISKKNSLSTENMQPIITGNRSGAVLSPFVRFSSRCGIFTLKNRYKTVDFFTHQKYYEDLQTKI